MHVGWFVSIWTVTAAAAFLSGTAPTAIPTRPWNKLKEGIYHINVLKKNAIGLAIEDLFLSSSNNPSHEAIQVHHPQDIRPLPLLLRFVDQSRTKFFLQCTRWGDKQEEEHFLRVVDGRLMLDRHQWTPFSAEERWDSFYRWVNVRVHNQEEERKQPSKASHDPMYLDVKARMFGVETDTIVQKLGDSTAGFRFLLVDNLEEEETWREIMHALTPAHLVDSPHSLLARQQPPFDAQDSMNDRTSSLKASKKRPPRKTRGGDQPPSATMTLPENRRQHSFYHNYNYYDNHNDHVAVASMGKRSKANFNLRARRHAAPLFMSLQQQQQQGRTQSSHHSIPRPI